MYQESKQMQHANNNRNGYCHIQIDIYVLALLILTRKSTCFLSNW